jgi:hypothetical protein
MKTILAVVAMILALVVAMPVAAASKHKNIPLPRPNPLVLAALDATPVSTVSYTKPIEVAQVTNPDPFNVKREGNAVVVQPSPNAAPVTVQTSPVGDIHEWIRTTLLGLLAALAGAIGLKLPGKLSGSAEAVSGNDKKAHLEAVALKLLESGVPSQVVAAALGFIPGNAGFAAMEEKALNRAALALLMRSGTIAPGVAGETVLQPSHSDLSGIVQDALKKIDFGALMKDALAKHNA